MINELLGQLHDHSKDIRLNIDSLLSETGTPGLSADQKAGVFLACSYALMEPRINQAIEEHFSTCSLSVGEAAKSAASIMAMNNVYYRFLHLSDDKEFAKMPARLRMNVIAKPGVDKQDFELMSLAVSALSGCGMCINSHISEVKKHGVSNEAIQSSVRIAACLNALKTALGSST